jgi:hypothetical protein
MRRLMLFFGPLLLSLLLFQQRANILSELIYLDISLFVISIVIF